MTRALRPLLLALVLVGGVDGDNLWYTSEEARELYIRQPDPLTAFAMADGGSIEVVRLTTDPWDGAGYSSMDPLAPLVLYVPAGRARIIATMDEGTPQNIGHPDRPWPSPLTIYVRRGVPVTVVEVDP